MTWPARVTPLWAAAILLTTNVLPLSLQATNAGSASEYSPAQIRLASPADGAYVSGPSILRADVVPPDAADSVVFFVDGREICRRTTAPFECEWDAGATITAHNVRLVVNLRAGGRTVQTVRTSGVAFAETVDVDVVQVTTTVTDSRGHYVKGLPRSAFRVFEDGAPQAISHFYADDAPLELVVALDLSSSMVNALPAMKRAVATFLRSVPAQHRLTLLGFNDEVFTLVPRSAVGVERERVVLSLSAWGLTALYEAIIQGVDMLGSRPGRKAVLVFTDGQDQGSRVTVDEVERTVQAGDVILYMIGQGQGTVSPGLKQLMERLANPTGGRALSTNSIDALQDAFTELFDEMAHQYVLGYQAAPGPPGDDRWREIKVEVNGDYRVRARQGYRKSQPSAP
jgi:Ca-activated chloride channel family protein